MANRYNLAPEHREYETHYFYDGYRLLMGQGKLLGALA